VAATAAEDVAEGRAALRDGDTEGARQAFESALAGGATGDAHEGLARVAYLKRSFPEAIELWIAAYTEHRAAGDGIGAVRVARGLCCVYGSVVGDWAVASGWLARAQRLVDEVDDAAERGWVALTRGMFDEDRGVKERLLTEAIDVGRDAGDADLTFGALAYLGASYVHGDRTEEGMVLLDEAMAAVAGEEVDDPFIVEEIFCQLFSACERAQDVERAQQWLRVGDAIAARRHHPAVAAYCHTHFGGVMTAAGRWSEAEESLIEAVRLWTLGQRTLKGGAIIRLADLRVRQGRLEEAEQLLTGVTVNEESAGPLAALALARGDTARAIDVLELALGRSERTGTGAVPLLSLLAEVHLAAGNLAEARAAVEALQECAEGHPARHLRAVLALAQGRLALATGTGDASALLRDAIDGFAEAHLPLESARSHLELAAASVATRPDVALREARAALDAFERLRAARHVDAASALLRQLGVRTPAARSAGADGLTRREEEVLGLLALGLSNPEIAERLVISRKTVEHHVANVLAKLGLGSRGEVAAYVAMRKPAAK